MDMTDVPIKFSVEVHLNGPITTASGVVKGGIARMHAPVVAGNFFKAYYFCCVEFLCILFSRIFSMCFRLLGGFVPRPPPGLCPWTPQGDFRPPDLLFCHVANSWLYAPEHCVNGPAYQICGYLVANDRAVPSATCPVQRAVGHAQRPADP